MPTRPNIAIAGVARRKPAGPAIPPEVIAYQAVAQLVLTPPRPVVGPPPEINPWRTAAVGYPLWLSTTGTPDPPAVSDTVFDVAVALHAHLQQVVFDLGDGHRVTCTDTTHPWSREVEPGTASPWCGYAYPAAPRSSSPFGSLHTRPGLSSGRSTTAPGGCRSISPVRSTCRSASSRYSSTDPATA